MGTANASTVINLNWTTGGATNWLIGYRPLNTGVPLTIVTANSNPTK
ncbi:MAG: hypothetical protein U5L96_04820 [Owenweeksia sp.]|nr:hypothetical protein [Owenweeksia sp.]